MTTWYRVIRDCNGNACSDPTSNAVEVTVVADPTISASGATTICSGGTAALSSTTSGGVGNCTYQWQHSTTSSSAGFTNISFANAATYNTPVLTTTTWYRVIRDCDGNACPDPTSNAVEVTVVADPTISVSGATTICSGGTAALTSSTSGGAGSCTYQWQQSTTSSSAGFTNISFANAANYNTPALTVTTWYRVIRDCDGADCADPTSNAVEVTVVADPTISASGATTICSGGTAALTSSTSGGTGSCTYQWQQSTTSSSAGFTNISFANGATYNTPALTLTTWYRVIRDCDGADCADPTSNAVEVTVVADPTISASGATTICSGGTVALTSSTSGGAGSCTYQWQQSTTSSSAGFTNISFANAANYNTPALTVTTWYRVIRDCDGADCADPTSNAVEVTVVADPTITAAGATTICSGGTAALTSSTSGGAGSCTYQWQQSTTSSSAGFTNISFANAANYNTPVLSVTTWYRVIRDCDGSDCADPTSNAVEVTVVPAPTISASGATAICLGGTATLSSTTSGGAGTCTYQWQQSTTSASAGFTNISFANAATYNTPSLTVTTWYRVIWDCDGNSCPDPTSNAVEVTVDNTAPTATCQNVTIELNALGNATIIDTLANSSAEFSGTQGQDDWTYGQYFANSTLSFAQLPTWSGFVWHDAQSFSTPFLDANGGHPGVDDLKWSVRRWTSDFAGNIKINGDFYDRNTSCGDGGHVRIFKNVNEVYTYENIPGTSTPYSLWLTVAVGDKIDFIIDPKFTSGCDDMHFTGVITRYLIDNSSADNCHLQSLSADLYDFDCNDLGNVNVTLTANDNNGNSSNCVSTVTVQATNIGPTAPSSISGNTVTCPGNQEILTAIGGDLGPTGSYWWADNAAFTGAVTSGSSPIYTTPVINATTTYYVRIHWVCTLAPTAAASITITPTSPSSIVHLIGNGESNLDEMQLTRTCEENGWTYYTHSLLPDKYVFAINWDPPNPPGNLPIGGVWNDVAKNAALPKITVDDNFYAAIGTPASNCQATWTMKRYWNVDLQGTELDGPVLVRFYYDIAERNEIMTEMWLHASLHTCGGEGFDWFKTKNTPATVNNPFDPPTDVAPINILNSEFLYDFNDIGNAENNVLYAELLVFSFSGGTGATGTGNLNNPLPVELVTLTATALNNSIMLDWSTLSEINNDRFDVMKSTDGINFVYIGEVPGHGTTADPHIYNFEDTDVEPGILYYYRLRQVDYDGTTDFSSIVTAMIDADDLQLFVGELIPNPTVDVSYIDMTIPNRTKISVTVLNMLGQKVNVDRNIELPPGNQRIEIDATRLSKGNYLVNLFFENGESYVRKLIVIE